MTSVRAHDSRRTSGPEAVPVIADAAAHRLLDALARTEDLRFSPDNRRLVISGFARNVVVLLEVEVLDEPDGAHLAVHAARELRSEALDGPHGVDWFDDDTLIVANRNDEVRLLRLPRTGQRDELIPAGPPSATPFEGLRDPGSVVVTGPVDGLIEVLVCNNAGESVSRHLLDPGSGAVRLSEPLVGRGLQIPDGLAVTADRRWLAVSNHIHRVVMLYDRAEALDLHSDPACVLRGSAYPHGLRFTADGAHLLVADAGSPHVNVYLRPGAGWHGALLPDACVRVKDGELFARGRHSPQEGGPKGIDLDRTGRLVVLTSEHQPLVVFRTDSVVAARTDESTRAAALLDYELGGLEVAIGRSADANLAIERARAAAAEAEHRATAAEQEAWQVRQALTHERERHAATTRRAEAAEAHVAALQATRLFRLTSPLRAVYARFRR